MAIRLLTRYLDLVRGSWSFVDSDYLYPVALFFIIMAVWTGLVRVFNLPLYILPTPYEAITSFQGNWDVMVNATKVTLFEAAFGWILGNIIGVVMGLILAESRAIKTAVYPYFIIIRSIPVIAFAPLLIIWMGINIGPILATATITTFFPTLVNCVTGFSSTDQLTRELMHSLDASKWDVLRHVKIYNALPYILTSLRITVALAWIGAIVGEWLVADEGLGYLIVLANNQLDTLLLFRSIIIIGLLATTWFLLVSVLESVIITWKPQGEVGAVR